MQVMPVRHRLPTPSTLAIFGDSIRQHSAAYAMFGDDTYTSIRQHTSSTLAIFGEDTNSSSSATMFVCAYAMSMAVSMTERASCVLKSFVSY